MSLRLEISCRKGLTFDADKFKMRDVDSNGASMTTATVTRIKLYPVPGHNCRMAWRWQYSVEGLNVVLAGFDRLSIAERMARQNGATSIVRAWEAA